MLIEDVIQSIEDRLYSGSMVVELCDVDITDYQRGIVRGRIEVLNEVKRLLESDYEDKQEEL